MKADYTRTAISFLSALSIAIPTIASSQATPTITTGELDFLDTFYASTGVEQCVERPTTYSLITPKRLFKYELPYECLFIGYSKIPDTQAREEFRLGKEENGAYQVFYHCPISDGERFPSAIRSGLIYQSKQNKYVRFIPDETVYEYLHHDTDKTDWTQDYTYFKCGVVFGSGQRTPVDSEEVSGAEFVGAKLRVRSDVNFRSGPGKRFSALGAFRRGDLVTPTNIFDGWYEFEIGGRKVYSYSRYFEDARLSSTQIKTPQAALKFTGFSCEVASYGSLNAQRLREKINSDLYGKYGCTALPEAHVKPGYRLGSHTETRVSGPWSGFASRNTVLYYSDGNQNIANRLASDLSTRYGKRFVAQRGGGQGVRTDWYNRTFIIHVRDDK